MEEFFILMETTNNTEIVFGSVRATDPDLGNVVAYSISSVDLCANITINPNNGQLKTTEIIDREVADTITCVVTAMDSGANFCATSATVCALKISTRDCLITFWKSTDHHQRRRHQRQPAHFNSVKKSNRDLRMLCENGHNRHNNFQVRSHRRRCWSVLNKFRQF